MTTNDRERERLVADLREENYRIPMIDRWEAARLLEADAAERQRMVDAVPTNWLDPLLTGDKGIGPPPYDCPAIEKLLRGIKARIAAIAPRADDNKGDEKENAK